MSGVNITVYDGKNAQQAAQRAESAAKKAKEQASVTSGALTDPIPPGTESEPAVLPPGPTGQKVKFEPEPGFYQGFDEITSDKRWYFYWNDTEWSLKDMGDLPRGSDGVDGASLLKEWSDTSEEYPYGLNVAVRNSEGVIYVSIVSNNTFPLEDETAWLSTGAVFKYEESEDFFKLLDAEGNQVASWDKYGKFRTHYAPNSIEAHAIEGLLDTMKSVRVSEDSHRIITFVDANDGILGFVDKNGTWNLPSLKTSSVEVIEDKSPIKVTNKRFFKIQNCDLLEVNILSGRLPSDYSPTRLPTRFAIELISNGKKLITLNVEAAVQGNSSAAFSKRGFTFDLYNDKWKSVTLSLNDLIEVDSFHIKSFWLDFTHTRDVGSNMLFYEMAKTRPTGEFFKEPELRTDYNITHQDVNFEGARWGTWGIPCILSTQGTFYGLYTWRLKKSRPNYLINRDNPNHIFIENQVYNVGLGRREYDWDSIVTDYEFRSPRNIGIGVQDNVMDFFSYARSVYLGQVDLRSTYQDHLVLTSWLDAIIHGEVIGHTDSVINNIQYITYDGRRWQPLFTDGDWTMGTVFTATPLIKEVSGYITNFTSMDIFRDIRITFLPELRERYTFLRNNGILTFQNFRKIFGGISQKIPKKVYEMDYEKWGTLSTDVPTMNQIYYYLLKRLEWLDTVWLND